MLTTVSLWIRASKQAEICLLEARAKKQAVWTLTGQIGFLYLTCLQKEISKGVGGCRVGWGLICMICPGRCRDQLSPVVNIDVVGGGGGMCYITEENRPRQRGRWKISKTGRGDIFFRPVNSWTLCGYTSDVSCTGIPTNDVRFRYDSPSFLIWSRFLKSNFDAHYSELAGTLCHARNF